LQQDFRQYVRNLSGTQRTINAYFGELLDGLPGELVQFMLRTAILDRLCAPVTGTSSSRELLASIEKRQLLLVPLDQEGRWYHYHPLLAEYLTKRLEAELGNEIAGCISGPLSGMRPRNYGRTPSSTRTQRAIRCAR
jgi:LuxR family transcriptional regulator, maltose regulon positive regulatory protein